MIMVGHEAVGVADPVVAFVDVLEGVQEVLAVLVVLEDGLFLVPPGGNVINCAGIFYAEGAGHERRITEKTIIVKPQDLTLRFPLTDMHLGHRGWLYTGPGRGDRRSDTGD
jgi:hypothetical protein